MDFQKSKTKQNLARSFAAECQEGARYQFLSKKAMGEDLQYLSAILRTLAHNEMAHATRFFQEIESHGGAETQNIEICAGYPFSGGELAVALKKEAENERSSAEKIYPKFAQEAREEGYDDIAELFEMVAEVERSHEHALDCVSRALQTGSLYKSKNGESSFKCDNCGIVVRAKMAPTKCPLCEMKQGYYRIDFEQIFNNNCAKKKDCGQKHFQQKTQKI